MTRPAYALARTLQLLELESRDVPAGNVTVTQLGTELRVIGDAEVNNFTVRGKGPGVVEISGAGTTINGGVAKVTATGVEWLRVTGRENDDVIKTSDLEITTVHLFGEGGNDVLDITGGTGDVLWALGGNGEDAIQTNNLSFGEVHVVGEDGNDTLTTQNLSVGYLDISGSSGDDVIRAANTSGTEDGLYMSVGGDGGGPNGSDTITVTGTTVQGGFAVIYLQGDDFYDTVGGLDRITLANTKINVGYADIGIAPYGEYGLTEPGNIITVDNFDLTVDNTPYNLSNVTFQGGSGDDHFYLHNINVKLHSETDVEGWVFVGSYEGNDSIDAKNLKLSATTDRTVGNPFELFNQFVVSFYADTVRIDNLNFVGGGTFSDGSGQYHTGGSVGITGTAVDVRNAHVHTNGFGGLGIDAGDEIYFGESARDRSWTVANVQVTSADGLSGDMSFYGGSGNERIQVTNASSDTFGAFLGDGDDSIRVINSDFWLVNIDLGEGNDSLIFMNVDFNAHFVYPNGYESGGINAGGGNDAVSMTNCDCETLILSMGDGDDSVSLKNNTFGTADLFGGDGTDDLYLFHNSGLFNIDGFEP